MNPSTDSEEEEKRNGRLLAPLTARRMISPSSESYNGGVAPRIIMDDMANIFPSPFLLISFFQKRQKHPSIFLSFGARPDETHVSCLVYVKSEGG